MSRNESSPGEEGRRVFSNKSPVNSSKKIDDGLRTVVEEKRKEREGKKEASLAKVARFRIA